MTALVTVENLKVRRADRPVLDVDHLEIQEGEILAVIGPNGAGKSTLLMAISRLLEPESGTIIFHGKSIRHMDELAYRRQTALVLQEALLLDTTVLNNAAAGLRFRKYPRKAALQQAQEWLDRLGVGHLKNRHAREISGGEAQRVSLARAFALQPELLMLDEPFSALDAPTRSRLVADFSKLQTKTGVTTIFITHELDEALTLGDQTAVMLGGRIRQTGSPQQVFSSPADQEVAEFVGIETVMTGSVTGSRDGQLFVEIDGIILEACGNVDVGRQVVLYLRPEDVTLLPDNAEFSQGSGFRSSARNRIRGVIDRLSNLGALEKVYVDCGFPLTALITRASKEDLGLQTGINVIASFKASALHVIPR